MISYERIKKWFQDKENKNKVVLGTCFVLVFIVGFGTGNFNKDNRKEKETLNNYNINSVFQTTGQVKGGEVGDTNNAANTPTLQQDKAVGEKGECIIKGNISSSGLVYHVPGGSFYERTNPEMCFETEDQAKAAGFRRSSR